MGGPWEDYSATEVATAETPPWADYGGEETTDSRPSYKVDVKSKKALAKNQLEMLKRNPDFKAMSKAQQAELLGQAEGGLVNPYADTNIFKEGAQFAGETGLAMANSVKKVGTDVGTLARYAYGVGKGLLPGNDYATEEYKGLQAADQMQKDFKPWEMPKEYGQSVTGQKIGEAFQAGEEGLSRLTGEYLDNPELGKQIAGVGMNTMMFAPVAKGVMKRTTAVGPTETGAALKPESGFGAGFTEPSPVSSAVRGTADLALRAIDKVPYMSDTSLYTQALKTGSSTSAKGQKNRAKAIETGLNEGIIISPSGEAILGKGVKDIINDTFGDEGGLWQQGEAIVKSPEFANKRIDLGLIEERAKASASELAAGGRKASRDAVVDVIGEMKEHPSYDPATNTISAEAAYREKQKLYRGLEKAYEQDVTVGKKDAQVNIAAELRQVTGDIIPDLKEILAKESENINFMKYAKRRMENLNTGGLLGGSSLGLMIDAPRAIALRVIQSPGFKSRLAIAIRAAKKRNVTNAEVNGHVNSIVEAMSKSPEEQKQLQAPAGAVEGEYIPPKAEAPVTPEAPIIEGQRPIAGEIGYTPNFQLTPPWKQLPESSTMIAGEKGGVFNPSTPQAPGMTGAEIASAAKKIGVPVAVVTAYLMADDETKARMSATMPVLLTVFGARMPENIPNMRLPRPKRFGSVEDYGIDQAPRETSIHASPHAFEKPDVYANIGRGQGASAFGEGLYSAQSRGVQNSYFNEFFGRAPAMVGEAVVDIPTKYAQKMSGKTVAEAIDMIKNDPYAFMEKRHHDFKRKAMDAGEQSGNPNYVFPGMSGSGNSTHPYIVVRDGGFAQPVFTGTNKLKIGNGAYSTTMQSILDANNIPFDVKEAIRKVNRREIKGVENLMEESANLDDAVSAYLQNLPKDKYYVEPGNITAIATKLNPGKWGEFDANAGYGDQWRILPFETKHLKQVDRGGRQKVNPIELQRTYNTPQDAMATWNNLERINQRKPKADSAVDNPVVKKLEKFASDEVISKKTPQYRLEHAPTESYINYEKKLTEQPQYVQDRLATVFMDLEKGKNPESKFLNGSFINKTGWELYVKLGKEIAEATGKSEKEGRKLASQYLNSIGIGGLRYPSAGMSNTAKPNFVHFFDPNIVEKNIGSKVERLHHE